jgi:hypothetical protein
MICKRGVCLLFASEAGILASYANRLNTKNEAENTLLITYYTTSGSMVTFERFWFQDGGFIFSKNIREFYS